MALDATLYTATATATGGRAGPAATDDGRLSVTLSTPKGLGGDDGPGMGTTSDPSTGPEATVGSATGPGSGGSETAVVDDTQGSSTGEPTSGFGPIGPLVGPEGEGSFRFGAASAAARTYAAPR